MKVITKGHKYELSNFEPNLPDAPQQDQTIQFIEKLPNALDQTKLDTVNNGTTNEEVLKMLINRMNYLQDKFPCRENAIVITHLEESLMWLEKRTADRVDRGVEGTHVK